MSLESEREDRTILEALDALASGRLDGELEAGRGDEASQTLVRLYTEVLGLLPHGLEPVAPSPGLKERLLALVSGDAGDETQEVGPEGVRTLAATPEREAREAREERQEETAAPRRPVPVAAAPPAPRAPQAAPAASSVSSVSSTLGGGPGLAPPRRRAARWPLALAAALLLALVGLSAWLYQGLRQQGETIAVLSRQLEDSQRRNAELETARTELVDLRDKLSLVTSPAVEITPLRPAGPQPGARGLFFVAADHQHWYLSVDGLEPARPGQEYQLWFIADTGPVSAGTFTAAPGAPIALSSESMPAGTRAVIVTLEPEHGATAPTGPQILSM